MEGAREVSSAASIGALCCIEAGSSWSLLARGGADELGREPEPQTTDPSHEAEDCCFG